jgi:hypothetical protein
MVTVVWSSGGVVTPVIDKLGPYPTLEVCQAALMEGRREAPRILSSCLDLETESGQKEMAKHVMDQVEQIKIYGAKCPHDPECFS